MKVNRTWKLSLESNHFTVSIFSIFNILEPSVKFK
jgi:hypothetical protein